MSKKSITEQAYSKNTNFIETVFPSELAYIFKSLSELFLNFKSLLPCAMAASFPSGT